MVDCLVEERSCHHWCGGTVLVEAELLAQGIVVAAVLRKHRVANAGQVRRLTHVVAVPACPNQHVICKMAHGIVTSPLRACQDLAQRCDMLVVPGVAVCNGGAVSHPGDLVTVVPPCHDARIFRCVLLDPLIAPQIVVHRHLHAVLKLSLKYKLRVRHVLGHHVAVLDEFADGCLACLARCHQDGHGHKSTEWPVQNAPALPEVLLAGHDVLQLPGAHQR
mmetsp:Transcript_21245/g.61325  ORF Transcript_21245/g.61325 Transcript_21245/m.61325 type:complete len:220 (-) Transcript_21245:1551-2210(-)